MRRDVLAELPGLSELFGLKPWDIPHLTADEVKVYRRALRERVDQQKKQTEQARGVR